jgi:TPR repeat protein
MPHYVDYDACYRTLGLPLGSSLAEIKATQRFLLTAFHPDRFRAFGAERQAQATQKTQEVNRAADELVGYWRRYDAAPPSAADGGSTAAPAGRPRRRAFSMWAGIAARRMAGRSREAAVFAIFLIAGAATAVWLEGRDAGNPSAIARAGAVQSSRSTAPVTSANYSAVPAVSDPERLAAGVAAYGRGQYAEALRMFEPLAASGSYGAQYYLALMHLKGQGTAIDRAAGIGWMRKAALAGSPEAQKFLGEAHGSAPPAAAPVRASTAVRNRPPSSHARIVVDPPPVFAPVAVAPPPLLALFPTQPLAVLCRRFGARCWGP